jgi:hypothetical protein
MRKTAGQPEVGGAVLLTDSDHRPDQGGERGRLDDLARCQAI